MQASAAEPYQRRTIWEVDMNIQKELLDADIAAHLLVEKWAKMDDETKKDFIDVLNEVSNKDTPEERKEAKRTISELLYPE